MKSPYKTISLATCLLSTLPAYSAQNSCSTAETSVLNATSSIIGIPAKDLAIKSAFSEQAIAGDALDIVEIIMTIEEDLNIEIPDHLIEQKTNSSDVTDLPHNLTIEMLQEIVTSECSNT